MTRGKSSEPACLPNPRDKVVYDLWVAPSDPSVLVAATASGLYRSTDEGATFSVVDSPVFTEGLAFLSLHGDASRLFAGNDLGGVFLSNNAGETWQTVVSPSAEGVPVYDLAATSSALYVAYAFGFLGRTESLSESDYTIINDPTAGGDHRQRYVDETCSYLRNLGCHRTGSMWVRWPSHKAIPSASS